MRKAQALQSRTRERFCDNCSKVLGNESDKEAGVFLSEGECGRDGEGKSKNESRIEGEDESKDEGEGEVDRASDASSKQTASSAATGSNTNKQRH